MASLTIRNLPDAVKARLRIRAAAVGRSMEAEARHILTAACATPAPGAFDATAAQELVASLYGGALPEGVVDDLIAERRAQAARE